ncbi:cytochrome c oxidase assembly protein [Luteimonas sp. RD2P54]|uniref:Cytochrome c oxidase assembly protein n=1 Tax=Luteimonas endophytica TaxID=3042023 RepID=A0ABT6JDI7_9GAMM|nr:cytochrome c oxidase assembly protein [Luteimonas endophytica]MDH5824794.1 cytochrome c oxidase assembly protein [Luteimonas endophytica]
MRAPSRPSPRSRSAQFGRPPAVGVGALLACGLGASLPAFAHQREGVPTLATAWSLSPWLLVPLALLVLLYAIGLARLWRRAGAGHGVGSAQACAFAAGILALLLATVWPLDALGEWSLAAHMGQHMLLLALVPPLLLAGRPLAVAAVALPRRGAQALHRATHRTLERLALALAIAAAAHVAVMLAWHLPSATAAALASDPVHWLMHGSFLAAGLWFWAALWRRIRMPDTGAGAGVVALVAVMMAMGLLGALLTFSPRPLYPVYVQRAPLLGLDPLADQQLAGIVMWIPSALPYLFGGLWLLWLGFDRIGRRDAGPAPRAGDRPGRPRARGASRAADDRPARTAPRPAPGPGPQNR